MTASWYSGWTPVWDRVLAVLTARQAAFPTGPKICLQHILDPRSE